MRRAATAAQLAQNLRGLMRRHISIHFGPLAQEEQRGASITIMKKMTARAEP